jgi:hypothetical protein
MFPVELEERAFRASNGEFGWPREDLSAAVSVLVANGLAILGGELWWVPDGANGWTGLIPLRGGSIGVYHWETERDSAEKWLEFVRRGAAAAVAWAELNPGVDDQPANLTGRILYNLTFVSEVRYLELLSR